MFDETLMVTHPTNIAEYLKLLPKHSKKDLYKSPVFSVSFLKMFDENTTKFIFDLLLKSHSVSSLREIKDIKDILKTLLVVQMVEKRGNNVYLDEDFRSSVKKGICMLVMEKYYRRTAEEAVMDENRCNSMFEDVLKFVVNKEFEISEFGIREILVFGGLLDTEKDITNKGFEFLLKTKKEQLWYLILLSMKYFLGSVGEEIAVVEALFELSTKTTGVVYQQLRPMDSRLFRCFSSLGLLGLHKHGVVLARSFVQLFEAAEQNKREFIILETNHKIYAYTRSEYEKSVIHLFSNVAIRLPNLIKGTITEESMNSAFDKGITSKQIIHFLQCSVIGGYLSPSISNQIEIWESKRNRIFMTPGYLYSNFLNLSDYQRVLEFCIENNCVIESDLDRRIVIVRLEAHNAVKDFVKTIL